MCHQTTYTLTCEHVKTHIVYCAEAPAASPPSRAAKTSPGSGAGGPGPGSGSKRSSPTTATRPKRKPCKNLTRQSLPYPTPPSFAGDPSTAASSPLAAKCPLSSCPFEVKNRRWNCCWCGKGWNERGRCSCIMIIDGSEVQCEHLCCETCEAAGASADTA